MHRKCVVAPLVIVASLVFLSLTGTAAASETSFYDEFTAIPLGMKVPIESKGTLTITLRRKHLASIRAECVATGVEVVWNEIGVGRDETPETNPFHPEQPPIRFACAAVAGCGKPVITPSKLPWSSRLFGEEHPLLDEWSGVTIDFLCKRATGRRIDYGVFKGALIPKQGDADEQCEGKGDDMDNEFRFVASGLLLISELREGTPESTISLVGFYKLGTRGHGVTGEVFPCKSTGLGK